MCFISRWGVQNVMGLLKLSKFLAKVLAVFVVRLDKSCNGKLGIGKLTIKKAKFGRSGFSAGSDAGTVPQNNLIRTRHVGWLEKMCKIM